MPEAAAGTTSTPMARGPKRWASRCCTPPWPACWAPPSPAFSPRASANSLRMSYQVPASSLKQAALVNPSMAGGLGPSFTRLLAESECGISGMSRMLGQHWVCEPPHGQHVALRSYEEVKAWAQGRCLYDRLGLHFCSLPTAWPSTPCNSPPNVRIAADPPLQPAAAFLHAAAAAAQRGGGLDCISRHTPF